MSWDSFIYFAMAAVLLWAIGAYAAWRDNHPLPVFNLSYRSLAYAATLAGLLVFFSFIILFWISLERPPLRTMGETRLWYSFFLPLAGLMVYSRWKYKWILSFSTLLALVFICVNLFKPEIHSKTLMPALQSPWFAPHVIVYMFAYALLGAATLMALFNLVKGARTGRGKESTGRGTPRRLGLPSRGSVTWSIYTTVTSPTTKSDWHSGCSSSPSYSCKCAGGASTICLVPSAVQYILTARDEHLMAFLVLADNTIGRNLLPYIFCMGRRELCPTG